MKEPIHPEEKGYVNPLEEDYKFPYVPRWLGSLIAMIVSACFLWWPQILRMLNSFLN